MESTPFEFSARDQLAAYLESLRAAGVEWLPRRAEGVLAPVASPSASAPLSSSVPNALPAEEPMPKKSLPAAPANETAAQPETAAEPSEGKLPALRLLAEEIRGCTRCPALASTRTQTVFADGNPDAEVCFIGEAPGADEDAQGLPFVGAAGQLLNKIIDAMGLRRDEVYICNILKCRPPGNRTPLPDEAANCRGFLERQLDLVRPSFIVALGGCAATNLLQTTTPLGKLRGRFHEYRGIPVLVTYHPAYLLPHRSPDKKKDVWEDMKMLLTRMGRPIPTRR